MIRLEVADLVVIAGHVLELDTAQVLDLLDPAAAESALAQVRPDDDLPGMAAVLLCALVRERPLPRDNRQLALASMLQFLALNGAELDPDPPEAIAAVVADVAAGPLSGTGALSAAGPLSGTGALSAADVARWLAPRLLPAGGPVKPAGGPVKTVKEGQMTPGFAERIKKATMRRQPTGMFRRFTGRARRVVYLATEEARLLRSQCVGTEHLLLALVFENEGLAAKTLESLGLSLEEVRRQVTEITGHGQDASPPHVPFTPQVKKALEQSLREALSLGHNYIGTEHLLLGLLRVERGIAARVLTGLGADYDRVRDRVVELKSQMEETERQTRQGREVTPVELPDTAEELDQVRSRKEAALAAEDFETAKALRDRERELLAAKVRLEREMGVPGTVLAENQRLRAELGRLRGVLRDHGIEPDDGTARPARPA